MNDDIDQHMHFIGNHIMNPVLGDTETMTSFFFIYERGFSRPSGEILVQDNIFESDTSNSCAC